MVAECAYRPEYTTTQLCADGGTAASAAVAHRAGHDATRVVVVTPEGDVGDVWHRYEPATVAAVESHPEVELFRVTVDASSVFDDMPPAEWGLTVAPRFWGRSDGCNTVAEARATGAFSVAWCPDVATRESYAIVPRELVAIVARRCASWGGGHHPPRVEPAADDALSTVLRSGMAVIVGAESWCVLLLDAERATLTRDDDEVVHVALDDLRLSGVGDGWWAERVKQKAEKKVPKRAKGGAR